MTTTWIWTVTLGLLAAANAVELDERPATPGEWGYRPAAGEASEVTPPAFSWRPVSGVVRYELEVFAGEAAGEPFYRTEVSGYNVHCPPQEFPVGAYTWRYRGFDAAGEASGWSQGRDFRITAESKPMPMPPRDELLARIPTGHPRLFVRPEQMPELRAMGADRLKKQYDEMIAASDKLLASPPSIEEPPTYPEGTVRNSDPWRTIWWGNRTKVQATLGGAATLGFTWLLTGEEKYGQEAKRLLLATCAWDPKGATGYRYNDEAGMPYNYFFARTYTFINELLSADERELCCRVMKVRGEEMYNHLYPRHLWRPYSSHSNRAWHKLGELGVAFLGEIEGAEDWVWFAMNVFYNVYPVWSDSDGGWHEGSSYWSSYIDRFTWWADVMRVAMDINAYDKPFFSRIGYYPMYLMPPNKIGGGFGDLTASRRPSNFVSLMSDLAAQAGNPSWQWWVEANGGPSTKSGYVGYIRGALPQVVAQRPDHLPSSRVFRGTGQAYLNSNLLDAAEGVQVTFKSSPFGTQSHGYEANNSFLISAYGQRLLIRSGLRDSYGSDHHRHWMWSTRSTNNITVDGQGQRPHSAATIGRLSSWLLSEGIDVVEGEAGDCYVVPASEQQQAAGIKEISLLRRFTRSIVFVKPDLVLIYDRLVADGPREFTYWVHALNEIGMATQRDLVITGETAGCRVDILQPAGLRLAQTNEYDPNPRPRVKLREWHLTATTAEKHEAVEFVALYRPHRAGVEPVTGGELTRLPGGYLLRAPLTDGELVALLPSDDTATLSAAGLTASGGKLVVEHRRADGTIAARANMQDAMTE